MRARIRSPRCSCSLCFGVYPGEGFFGVLGMRVDVLFLSAFLIPLLQARRDDKVNPPLLPPDIRCLSASLRAGRTEGNPSEGISFLKPSQKTVCADETEPPCLIFGQGWDAIR